MVLLTKSKYMNGLQCHRLMWFANKKQLPEVSIAQQHTFDQGHDFEKYVIELKLYYDKYTREDGLEQTARYLSQLGLESGYLIIFETRTTKSWEERIYREEVDIDGKQVILLGM